MNHLTNMTYSAILFTIHLDHLLTWCFGDWNRRSLLIGCQKSVYKYMSVRKEGKNVNAGKMLGYVSKRISQDDLTWLKADWGCIVNSFLSSCLTSPSPEFSKSIIAINLPVLDMFCLLLFLGSHLLSLLCFPLLIGMQVSRWCWKTANKYISHFSSVFFLSLSHLMFIVTRDKPTRVSSVGACWQGMSTSIYIMSKETR